MDTEECRLCPRDCRAARGKRPGFCGEGAELRLASACLHFGEEPPLTGTGGSGAMFVTGCNLGCPFCQNREISQCGMGRTVDTDEFAAICLALQAAGALNINIVTGSHAVPALAAGLAAAKEAGLILPVCWNSSAYETPETLALIAPFVDIWLPDLKALSPRVCGALFGAPDYGERAETAIAFMISRALPPRFGADGRLLRGVIARHLFLPGLFDEAARVLRRFRRYAARGALISLMTQYTPLPRPAGSPAQAVFEDRPVSPAEAADLRDLIGAFGFDEVFFQELSPGSACLPDFRREQPFPPSLARAVWHWTRGMLPA